MVLVVKTLLKHSPCEFLTSCTCRTSDKRQPRELDIKLLEANTSSWFDNKDSNLKKKKDPKGKMPCHILLPSQSCQAGPVNENCKPNSSHVLASLHVEHALYHLLIKTA